MGERITIPLTPIPIEIDSPEFEAISGWPFADPFVGRLLRYDIPQRVRSNEGRVWVYRDPEGRLVGFGALDICGDYRERAGGRSHPYIPLLAVNPSFERLGHGTSIVRHLIGEAALLVPRPGCSAVLFLDVYATSTKAIELYDRCGFIKLIDEPIPDEDEGGKPYFIMARRVSIAPAQGGME